LLALGFGLLGHGAEHRFRHVDLLDFNVHHLHAPGSRVSVKNALQPQVDLVAVGKQFIEFEFPEHGTQRRLGELGSLVDIVGYFDDGFAGIDHSQEYDGIYLQSHVVAGDDVLGRNFERLLTQRNADNAVQRRKHQNYARSLRVLQQTTEPENDATFVFGQNL